MTYGAPTTAELFGQECVIKQTAFYRGCAVVDYSMGLASAVEPHGLR